MAIKLKLNSQQILDQKFNAVPRGYNPLDVDRYLDLVLSDYRVIEANCLMAKKEIEEKDERIRVLEEEKKRLEIQNAKYEKRLEDIKDNKSVTVENIDLIKRISVLEKFIYNHGWNPKTIK